MLHISRDNKWKIGDTFTVGLQENPFWLICKNYSPKVKVNEQEMSLFKMLDQSPNFEVTPNNIDFLYNNLKEVSKEVALYIREQVFEEVRKEHFPQLPS
jgi:hypothetical protein